MKVTSISVNRVYSLGNYENEKVGITVELAEGDDLAAAYDLARDAVYQNSEKKKKDDEAKRERYDRAMSIIKYPDHYHMSQLNEAYKAIAEYESITEVEAKKKYGFHGAAFDLISTETNALPEGRHFYEEEEDDDDDEF